MDKARFSDEELYNAILEIISGERLNYSEILNEVVKYKHPTGTEKLYLNLYEKQQLNKYLKEGHLSEADLTEELQKEFFSTEDQEALEEAQSKLKSYQTLLKKRALGTELYERDNARVTELQAQIQNLQFKRNSSKQHTAEYRAREDKYIMLMSQCLLTMEGNRKWNSPEELQEDLEDIHHLYGLLNEYLAFYFGFETSKIRQIARSPQWKNYYISSNRGLITLFNRPAQDLSLDQLNLTSWSIFYADVSEMSLKDRPSAEMLEDDERLDKYLADYMRKFEAESDLERSKASGKMGSASNHQHVIVTAESENYVSLHKKGMYSDTEIITSRAAEGSSKYSEKEEFIRMKRDRMNKKLQKGIQ